MGMTPLHLFAATDSDILLIRQQVGDSIVPPPPSSLGGGGGTFLAPELSITNVRTDAHTTDVVVSWTTSIFSTAVLTWGTEGVYGKGQSAEVVPSMEHTMSIDGLSPGTQYALSLRVTDIYGRVVTVEGVLLRTERLPDSIPPANVSDFTAIYQDEGVMLSWDNPPDTDFKRVRIVRSDMFFPEDPYDGLVVYEGRKEFARDTWVDLGTTYYYTAFAEDNTGNYASGALARIRIPRSLDEVFVPETDEGDMFGGIEILPEYGEVPEEIKTLSFQDFRFVQFGKDVERNGNTLVIDASGNLQILLGYDSVPEVLKTIGVTLVDPNDPSKVFPFLLRRDTEGDAYSATLAPLTRPGVYRISATVLDYKHQVLKRFEGKLIVPGTIETESFPAFIGVCDYCTKELNGWRFLFCYGWIALILILILLMRRKKKKKNY